MFYKRVSALEVYVTYFTMNSTNFNLDLVGNEDSLKEEAAEEGRNLW